METSNSQSTTSINYASNERDKHDELWIIAKRRAAFKRSLVAYLIMNVFFVAIWYFTSGYNSYYWPIWPMLGWGLGIAIQYFSAYHTNNFFTTEQEYEKLKNEQNR